jgi:putative MATE family efflux protein
MASPDVTAAPQGRGGFTEGPVRDHVVSLAGVMIVGFLAMTVASLIEVFYIGTVSKEALAAITFMFPIAMSLNAMTRGIGIGASSLIARNMGEGNHDQVAVVASHGYLLVVLFTVALSVTGQFHADALLYLLGARGEVLHLATEYAHIWLWGFPMMGLAMVSNGLIRSFGNVRTAGYIMTTGPLIQICLGPFLIFGLLGLPRLELVGVAWTFVVASLVQTLIAAHWYLVTEKLNRLALDRFLSTAGNILHVGVPSAATNLIQPLSAGVVTWMLSGYGIAVVAGFGVASRIESVVAMVVIGISTAIVPVVGQNWGARKLARVKEAMTTCYVAGMVWGLFAAVIMWLLAPFFVSVINDDTSLVDAAVLYLYIVPFSIGFMGLINVATNAFNALRKPMPALMISLARLFAVYIPLAFLGGHWFGYAGIFAATALANVIVGIAAVFWTRSVMAREWELLNRSVPV